MAHWLDRQARRAAEGQLTRRSLFSRGAGAATGVALSRYVGGPGLATAAVGVPTRRTRVGPCSLKTGPHKTTFSQSVKVRFGARHLTLDTSQTQHHGESPGATLRTVITLGHAMVLEVFVRKGPRGAAAEGVARFGYGFSGAREMTFTTTNGKTFSGEIDGRSYHGYRVGTDPARIRFHDGRPPPQGRVDLALGHAIQALFKRARKEAHKCHAAAKHLPRGSEDPVAARSETHSMAPSARHEDPVAVLADDTQDTGECALCLGGCWFALGTCNAAAATACEVTGPFYALCAGVSVGACFIAGGICFGLCWVGGAPCCPVTCGSGCCKNGESCLDSQTGACCGQDETPCNGKLCCAEGESCLPNGTCCPPDKVSTETICCPNSADKPPVSCDGKCCDTGEVCKDGVCCPPSSPICNSVCCINGACLPNGDCCTSPSHVCGDVCCGPFNTCCADVCCSGSDDVCINGTCCPQSLACGNTCCSSSQVCTDPSTGTCGPSPCPQGQTICQDYTKTASTCCNNGLECCNGTSCCDNSSGLYCCGSLGCVPSYECVH